MARILIVDDERDMHYSLKRALGSLEAEMLSAHSGEEALEILAREPVDLVLLDVVMGGMTGLQTLEKIRELKTPPFVIVMTAFATTRTAIEATRLGAYDYILKPFDVPALRKLVTEALRAKEDMARSVRMGQEPGPESDDQIVGNSAAMQDVYKMIGRAASSDVNVLILGESGTGKELVARAIYQHSVRSQKMFLPINCAAVPENLLESEFFGHERGAFTGAVERRLGKFEQCNGGTIFLDEIGDMPMATQSKVLRLIEDRAFQRVGGSKWIQTDIRLIAATNKDLLAEIAAGRFRQDLYYRLSVVAIKLPPLRQRREDIPDLARYFTRKYGAASSELPPETLDILRRYNWPGNVRELENAIRRASVLAAGRTIGPEEIGISLSTGTLPAVSPGSETLEVLLSHVFDRIRRKWDDGDRTPAMPIIERALIEQALMATQGNQVQASKMLGISRNTLRSRLRKYGLKSVVQVVQDPGEEE